MALLDPVKPHVLATKFIPNVAPYRNVYLRYR